MPVKELALEDATADVERLTAENKALCAKIDLLEAAILEAAPRQQLTPVFPDGVDKETYQPRQWREISVQPWRFTEETSFAEDSAYDANMLGRAVSSVTRGFGAVNGQLTRCGERKVVFVNGNPKGEWHWNKLPPFSPSNRLRVTVEILPS